MEPVFAATPYLVMSDLEGSVGVVRPIAGLLGVLEVVMGEVTTLVLEKGKAWAGAEGVMKGVGEDITGVVVIGVVIARAVGEERVGEGTIGVGVIVDVTCVMGLVQEEEA